MSGVQVGVLRKGCEQDKPYHGPWIRRKAEAHHAVLRFRQLLYDAGHPGADKVSGTLFLR